EDLNDVILVGHSYAGCVITGVADRAPARLTALVYCDAGPLPDGQSFASLQGADAEAALRAQIGDGWQMAFPGFPALGHNASIRGLGEAEQALMQRKSVPHLFGTWTQPLHLTHSGAVPYQRVVI